MPARFVVSLVVFGALVASASAAPTCAVSAGQDCACAVPITPGAPIGELTNITGAVSKTGVGGYTPIRSATNLSVGDGVLIGSGGAADLNAGPGCQPLRLSPPASVTVREVSGCACVSLVQPDPPIEPDPLQSATDAIVLGVTLGAILRLDLAEEPPISP